MGYSYFGNGTDTPGGPQQSRHVDVVPEALTSDEIIYNPVLEKLVMVFWLRMLRLSGKWWGKSSQRLISFSKWGVGFTEKSNRDFA